MQTLKDDIRQRIVAVAREEFIAHGARSTSIRTVARRAGIAAGNVYNYFRSKDELFCEVLRPLLKRLRRYSVAQRGAAPLHRGVRRTRFSERIHRRNEANGELYRPELRLLLFNAEGTSLAGYKERIADHQLKAGTEYLRLMKARYPHINIDISPFFLHIASSMWVNIFCELVEHEEYDESEVNRALEQYAAYSMAGWRELMKP